MPKRIGITILGCGAVGGATAQLLLSKKAELAKRTGVEVVVFSIVVRDRSKMRCDSISELLLTTDAGAAIADPRSQIIIELIGGTTTARAHILAALAAGKDVVTANKALLALHGAEIFEAARRAGRTVAFEASVGGGIPLIETVRRGLVANDIDAVYGILNGTCNFILTQMSEQHRSYADALEEAKRLGYAEADPTLDVEGIDSAHKLAILASIAFRKTCDFARIEHRGISAIEVTDLIAGEELGYVCKLLAVARNEPDGIELSVAPTFIHASHPLAGVRGPFNAVSIYGSAAGHVLLYGRGAGGLPTASAVVSDVIDVACGNAKSVCENYSALPGQTPAAVYSPTGERKAAWYLRVGLLDRPGGMAAVAGALG
ncbi:MAG TPA: homoserine dehydrogenase, partial [Phycisphaerae bacterium]|nr:homoserine dehydrogenase [Phycisphaerae bacterium]